MEVQKDFKELLKLFNAHNVQYLIVGGYALAYYGAPRYTGDIDILIKSDSNNASLILIDKKANRPVPPSFRVLLDKSFNSQFPKIP